MWTEQEHQFVQYWEQNRLRKKKWRRFMSVGMPLAVVLVCSIAVNMMARWHRPAEKELRREQSSLIIVLIAACLIIVAFIVIFSARYQWERNEQYYQELLSKKE